MFNSVLDQREIIPAGNLVSRTFDGSMGYAGSNPFIWRNEEQISIYCLTRRVGRWVRKAKLTSSELQKITEVLFQV